MLFNSGCPFDTKTHPFTPKAMTVSLVSLLMASSNPLVDVTFIIIILNNVFLVGVVPSIHMKKDSPAPLVNTISKKG